MRFKKCAADQSRREARTAASGGVYHTETPTTSVMLRIVLAPRNILVSWTMTRRATYGRSGISSVNRAVVEHSGRKVRHIVQESGHGPDKFSLA